MNGALDGDVDLGVSAIIEPLDNEQDGVPDGLGHIGRRAKAGDEGDGDGVSATEGGRPGLPRPQGEIGATLSLIHI